MLKDTKSLGNNKAPACESRGFVHKKRGVHFDTPPCLIGCLLSLDNRMIFLSWNPTIPGIFR